MRLLEVTSPYQEFFPFFGRRKGKIYSGNFAPDGTPVNNYGQQYRGLSPLIKSEALLSFLNGHIYSGVDALVKQKNVRGFTSSPAFSFSRVKGFKYSGSVRPRSSNLYADEDGNVVDIPVTGEGGKLTAGASPSPYKNFDALGSALSAQPSLYNSNFPAVASDILQLSGVASGLQGLFDIIPFDNRWLIQHVTGNFYGTPYTGGQGYLSLTQQRNPNTGAFSGGVAANLAQCGGTSTNTGGSMTYSVPLDESLIEYDASGNAVAYHTFYQPSGAGASGAPGELRYRKITLLPTVVNGDFVTVENITDSGWPTSGYNGTRICMETRPFVYTHNGVRYLTIIIKKGYEYTANPYKLTIKRAVLTNGVAGPFETFTFADMFSDYGHALVLSPDYKTLWHYPFDGLKVACFQFAEGISMQQQVLPGAGYINSIGVENDVCMVLTSEFRKFVLTPDTRTTPSFTLTFDKSTYNVGDEAELTVTTDSLAELTVTVQLAGTASTSADIKASRATPGKLKLRVLGRLQAAVVNWL